ncbi:MAG: type III-B CRISPR module RAMP protein Cmr4 [Anaerolineae bacterium]|nr:MAG: type III-B CRISPR module RAMP protein Cmr4 [Anaerolineae bacterium]
MDNNIQTRLLFIYTESPLHAGTGSGLSAVDLPIQRERTTQYPNIQGSGVKGSLRSQCIAPEDEKSAIFGPDTKNGSDHAGAVSVGEARIVLFPVRSLAGVFAYTTCPHVLARLKREAQRTGLKVEWDVPSVSEGKCLVTNGSSVTTNNKIVLEEFSFAAQQGADAIAQWLANEVFPKGDEYRYWREKVKNSLVILPDDAFRDFVVNSTEVTTRVRIVPDSKTVQDGALWTQEALPADTLMVSAVTARRLRVSNGNRPDPFQTGSSEEVLAWLGENLPERLQIGGDETTGAGQVALRWL